MDAIEIVNCVVHVFQSPIFTFIMDDGDNPIVEFKARLSDKTLSVGNGSEDGRVCVHELIGEDDYCFTDYSKSIEEKMNSVLEANPCK